MYELPQKPKPGKKAKALLLGVGLDHKDEHVRITRGDNFRLVGGSEETHGQMTETAIKFNEKLKQRGKVLEEVTEEEFVDLIQETSGHHD